MEVDIEKPETLVHITLTGREAAVLRELLNASATIEEDQYTEFTKVEAEEVSFELWQALSDFEL